MAARRRVAVAPLADIPEGETCVYEVEDRFIAISKVGGCVYAIEDRCTHDDGPLGEGCLYGYEIECPRHGARFDVRDGSVKRSPARGPVPVYRVCVEGDMVVVEIPGDRDPPGPSRPS